METYYLIDYENVGKKGIEGCDKLNKTDHIVIFFTENARKIDMSEIANHGGAELIMLKVPAGKQSADIHIGSYLGYLIGANKGSIVIISKDTDFDNVIKFWKDKTGFKASRVQQIKIFTSKAMTVKQTTPVKRETPIKQATTKVSGTKKTKLNQEVMQALSGAGFASVSNAVAKLVTGLYGEEHLPNEVHNALRKKYDNYLEVYEAIKPVLAKYTEPLPMKTAQSKTVLNNEIMKLLSKAGLESEIINYVPSIVVKNAGVKNGKQQIYRAIISKYGQNKGLYIYNYIKKHI